MTKTKSVTVAVCTRNRAPSLERAVRSVLEELATSRWASDPQFCLLVVDNGSTDGTAECVRRLQQSEPRLRYVLEPIAGIAVARNRALAALETEVVVFIDDDETVCPGFIEAHMDTYEQQPGCVAVGGAMDLYFDTGAPRWVSPALMGLYSSYPVSEGTCRPLEPRENPPFGGNLSLLAAAAHECGGFDPAFGRVDKSLVGGEETVLLEALRSAGNEIWLTGAARIRHHVPAERARLAWVLRRSIGQGRTEQRIAADHALGPIVLRLLFGGMRLFAKRRSVGPPVLVEYVVHRAYWVGRLTEAIAARRSR